MAATSAAPDRDPWRFLSNQSGTVESLLAGGAIVVQEGDLGFPDGTVALPREYIGFKSATPLT